MTPCHPSIHHAMFPSPPTGQWPLSPKPFPIHRLQCTAATMAFLLLSLHNQLEAEMMKQMVAELARKQV